MGSVGSLDLVAEFFELCAAVSGVLPQSENSPRIKLRTTRTLVDLDWSCCRNGRVYDQPASPDESRFDSNDSRVLLWMGRGHFCGPFREKRQLLDGVSLDRHRVVHHCCCDGHSAWNQSDCLWGVSGNNLHYHRSRRSGVFGRRIAKSDRTLITVNKHHSLDETSGPIRNDQDCDSGRGWFRGGVDNLHFAASDAMCLSSCSLFDCWRFDCRRIGWLF